jgi:predicted enzyme related to lactoylglutathione lyase
VAKGALNGVRFHTDDLDATFEKVRASAAEIVQEPTEQPWGTRDCAARDPSVAPEGNVGGVLRLALSLLAFDDLLAGHFLRPRCSR